MTEALKFIYWGILFIALLIGLLNMKRLTTPFKLLTLLIFVTLFTELVADYMAVHYRNNIIVYHIYTPIHAILLGAIYLSLLHRKTNRAFVWIATIISVSFAIANSLFIQGLKATPYYDLIVISIFYVCFAFISNFEMIRSKHLKLFNNAVFWLNSGTLLFFSINFILWSLWDYLGRIKSPVRADLLLILNILNFVLYAFFALAIYFDSRRNKST